MKTLLIGIVVFLVGAYMAWGDLKIDLWGKPADATLTNAWETTGRRGRKGLKLEYEFTDDKGETVRSGASVSRTWQPPADGKLKIYFVPGSPKNTRLAESSGLWSYLVFLAGVGMTSYGVWEFFKAPVSAAHRED